MILAITAPARLEFQIKDTKLFVSVVAFSKENDKKLLEQLKSRLKLNSYRLQMTSE